MPRLKVGRPKVPKYDFMITNEELVLRSAAQRMVKSVQGRTRAGQGSNGPLPRSKDGRPYEQSGQLIESIGFTIRRFRSGMKAEVLPEGDRSDVQARTHRRRRRRRETRKTLRRELKAQGLGKDEIKAELKKRIKRAPRLRRKNMDIAVILSRPPRDRRAKSGGRRIYDVFNATREERRAMRRYFARAARFGLVERETGIAWLGRGR